MAVYHQLASLALRGAAAAMSGVGFTAGAMTLEGIHGFLTRRFSDHSHKLTEALEQANERAWAAVEVALAGRTWLDGLRLRLATGDERGFRDQVSAFLAANPLDGLDGHGPDFRGQCLAQLRAARQNKLLSPAPLDPADLARRVGDLTRFGDAPAAVEAEFRVLADVADRLRREGYGALAAFLEVRPAGGPPVLVAAVRYFFQREVEQSQELFQGLAYARLEALQSAQAAGFAALERHADRLAGLLTDVAGAVARTHQDVLDMKAELSQQGRQMQELGQAVLHALAERQLDRRELQGADSLSVRDDGERRLVRDLVRRYRALPPDQRRQMPALLNAVGKLQVVAGDFEAAEKDFKEAATLVADPRARAEVAHNAYRAALERRAWADALAAAREAAALDGPRFAPFPGDKYEAEQILGAGGFGVAFLCRNRHSGGRVVIKTLRRDGFDRDIGEVFREAQALEDLEHPAIIRVRDCDFADAARKRPYIVMDYFPGQPLDELVERSGPLPPDDLVPLARLVAAGLQRAHAGGVLHRDVKPGNLLVRRGAAGWEAKLIDFGLALRAEGAASTAKASRDRTLAGSSIAGTLDYAAPEQLGKLRGVPVGPSSDVFGFGKTCCFALFGTPSPTFQHWQQLPPGLADLLGRCLSDRPQSRPQSFDEVIRDLDRLASARPASGPKRGPALPPPRPEGPKPAPAPGAGIGWAAGSLLTVVAVVGAGTGVVYLVRGGGGGPNHLAIPNQGRTPATTLDRPPAREVRPETNPFTAKELPATITQLRGGKVPAAKVVEDAKRFADTEPTAAMKARHEKVKAYRAANPGQRGALAKAEKDDDILTVSRALDGLLKDPSLDNRLHAIRAAQKWGTRENAPELVAILVKGDGASVPFFRTNVVRALAFLQEPKGVAPAVALLADHSARREDIVNAVRGYGPMAEDEVLKRLNGGDEATRRVAIEVLAGVGTKKSVGPLKALGGQAPTSHEVRDALEGIAKRGG